jgi:hypothetical protein
MNILIYLALGLVLMASKLEQNDPAFKPYFSAYQMILDENWKESINAFEKLVKDYPKSNYTDDAYFWIAYANKEIGNLEKAYDLYDKFLKDYSKSNLIENAKTNKFSLSKELFKSGKEKYKVEALQNNSYKDNDDFDENDSNNDGEKDDIQDELIFAIANNGGEKAKDKLMGIVTSKSQSLKNKKNAIFWLGNKQLLTMDEMYSLFKKVENSKLQHEMLFAITQYDTESKVGILKDILLSDFDYDIRKDALFWLSQTKGKRLDEVFADLALKIKEPQLRSELMFSISQAKLKNSDELLLGFALNEKEESEVRKNAIFWLGQNKAINQLKEIYAQANDTELQKSLIFSFAQIKTDESLDFIIKLVKNKATAKSVKKEIIFWLGQSKSSKAQKVLEDLLEN